MPTTRLLAATALVAAVAVPAEAGTTITGALYDLRTEAGALDASPLGAGLELRQDLGENVYVGGLLLTGIDADSAAPGTDMELGSTVAVTLGGQVQFSHEFGGYAFLGLGESEIEVSSAAASATGDGLGTLFGFGLTYRFAENGLVDVGWTSLYNDDLDFAGTDVDSSIDGLHVGLGFRL